MKFSKKFPKARLGDRVEHNNYEVVRPDNCVNCGQLTPFKELYSGVYICSDECEDAYYGSYFRKSLRH